jgi:hypothetical protein
MWAPAPMMRTARFGGSGSQAVIASFTVVSVNLSGTTLNMPAANAGDLIGAVTVTTNPPGFGTHGPITLGGADAASFALTNGGNLPCNLIVGVSNIFGGSYSITLTAI